MSEEVKKRASRTHCASGHELSDDKVRILNKGNGRKYKQCLTCKPGTSGSLSRYGGTPRAVKSVYAEPPGSRMKRALSRGVFGEAMTRADIMRNRS